MSDEMYNQEIWTAWERAEALGYGELTGHEAIFAANAIRRDCGIYPTYEAYFRDVYGEPI